MALVEKDAAIMIPDVESVKRLIPEAFELIGNDEKLKSLSKNIAGLAKPNAANDIAKIVLELAKNSK